MLFTFSVYISLKYKVSPTCTVDILTRARNWVRRPNTGLYGVNFEVRTNFHQPDDQISNYSCPKRKPRCSSSQILIICVSLIRHEWGSRKCKILSCKLSVLIWICLYVCAKYRYNFVHQHRHTLGAIVRSSLPYLSIGELCSVLFALTVWAIQWPVGKESKRWSIKRPFIL